MTSHLAQFLKAAISLVLALSAPAIRGQTPSSVSTSPIVGTWRADLPLPTGMVQTFRFNPDGKFHLLMAIAVDGQYRVDGDMLIETVALPGSAIATTDTAALRLAGDSLMVGEPRSANGGKTLHRVASSPAAAQPGGVVGDWTITLADGAVASYRFDQDGTMHIRAQVSDEAGTYTATGDTLRLSSDRTFQIPATTSFTVANDVLTLTPSSGHGSRTFHRVGTH